VSQYEDFSFLQEAAKAQTIPEKELVRLAKHPNRFIRWVVAGYVLTPQWLLEKLAKDEHWSVRYAVASNKNTAKVVVKYQLALDLDARVRQAAEENPLIDNLDQSEIFKIRLKMAYDGRIDLVRR